MGNSVSSVRAHSEAMNEDQTDRQLRQFAGGFLYGKWPDTSRWGNHGVVVGTKHKYQRCIHWHGHVCERASLPPRTSARIELGTAAGTNATLTEIDRWIEDIRAIHRGL